MHNDETLYLHCLSLPRQNGSPFVSYGGQFAGNIFKLILVNIFLLLLLWNCNHRVLCLLTSPVNKRCEVISEIFIKFIDIYQIYIKYPYMYPLLFQRHLAAAHMVLQNNKNHPGYML